MNGNEELNKIVGKLQQLSTLSQARDIKMKFCFVCRVEKHPEHNFCSSRNCRSSKLITPKSDRERLIAMSIILHNGTPEGIDSCETLKTVRLIVDPLIPKRDQGNNPLTAVSLSG
jgi:hypothetical protein